MKWKWLVAVLIALAVLLSPGRASAEWTAQDTALEITYAALHVIDWGQTRAIARNPAYIETNPILGENPSLEAVDLYFASTLVGHVVISRLLPEGNWRRLWQGVTIGYRLGYVDHNFQIGLKLEW